MCSQRTRSADIGFSGGGALAALEREQRGHHIVGVGGLGEIIDGAELHGIHRRRDVAVAGEHHAVRLGAAALERRDHVEPVAVAEPHVDHRERTAVPFDLQQPVRDGLCGGHRESPAPPWRAPAG